MNNNSQKLQIKTNSKKVDISPILTDWVECKISMLRDLLSAIEKWEDIACGEFSTLEEKYIKKYPKGFSGYVDPINERAFVIHMTELALYGSLSVNIAALVDDVLKSLGVDKSKLKNIKRHKNHLFIRALANRFKHSGGKTTKEFIKEFIDKYREDIGLIEADIDIDIDIEYDKLPWDKYIKETEEFLLDIVKNRVVKAD